MPRILYWVLVALAFLMVSNTEPSKQGVVLLSLGKLITDQFIFNRIYVFSFEAFTNFNSCEGIASIFRSHLVILFVGLMEFYLLGVQSLLSCVTWHRFATINTERMLRRMCYLWEYRELWLPKILPLLSCEDSPSPLSTVSFKETIRSCLDSKLFLSPLELISLSKNYSFRISTLAFLSPTSCSLLS